MAPPNPNTDGLLPAGVSGRLILRSEDKLTLFEQQSRRVISEIQVRSIWSSRRKGESKLHGDDGLPLL